MARRRWFLGIPGMALVVMLGGATPATATTIINFDDGVAGAPIGAFYAGLGVTFENGSWTTNFGLPGSSGPLGLSSTTRSFQPTPGDPIVGVFSSPVSMVGIRGIDTGENGIRIDVYDAAVGGNLIAF